jgi:hypothetical protein
MRSLPVLVHCAPPLLLLFLHFMSKQFQFKLVLLGVFQFLDAIDLIPIAFIGESAVGKSRYTHLHYVRRLDPHIPFPV